MVSTLEASTRWPIYKTLMYKITKSLSVILYLCLLFGTISREVRRTHFKVVLVLKHFLNVGLITVYACLLDIAIRMDYIKYSVNMYIVHTHCENCLSLSLSHTHTHTSTYTMPQPSTDSFQFSFVLFLERINETGDNNFISSYKRYTKHVHL